MFYKIDALKNFAKFIWKHLNPVTLLKRDSSAGFLLWILWNFQEVSFYKSPLDDSFCWIFSFVLLFFFQLSELVKTSFFLFLNMFSHVFWTYRHISQIMQLEDCTLDNRQRCSQTFIKNHRKTLAQEYHF